MIVSHLEERERNNKLLHRQYHAAWKKQRISEPIIDLSLPTLPAAILVRSHQNTSLCLQSDFSWWWMGAYSRALALCALNGIMIWRTKNVNTSWYYGVTSGLWSFVWIFKNGHTGQNKRRQKLCCDTEETWKALDIPSESKSGKRGAGKIWNESNVPLPTGSLLSVVLIAPFSFQMWWHH